MSSCSSLQIVGGIVDERESLVSATFELVHLPVVLIVAGLCCVAADVAARATPTSGTETSCAAPAISTIKCDASSVGR